jgi:AbiEi antitoxin C-terminal domain
MARLPAILDARAFPTSELRALVLDGEAYRVDEGVAAVDEIPSPILRAQALITTLPGRLIAEQHTAAWIWGAQFDPPAQHEVCADISARSRPSPASRLLVREVVILHEDVADLAGLRVTTPMRTAIDLARFVTEWTDDESRILGELIRLGGFSVLDCARTMNRRRNLPAKKLALERLALAGPAF